MSVLGCKCGHAIRDQTNNIAHKGYILRDAHYELFFDWATKQAASYAQAARDCRTDEWMLEQGYRQSYIGLKLSDENRLDDIINTRFFKLKRDIFECEACGRIHIEGQEDNRFTSYLPDNGKVNAILAAAPEEAEHSAANRADRVRCSRDE